MFIITFLGSLCPSILDHENLVWSFHIDKHHIFSPNKLFIFFIGGHPQAIHKTTQLSQPHFGQVWG